MPDSTIFDQDLPAFTPPKAAPTAPPAPASIFHTGTLPGEQAAAPSPGPANPLLNAATSSMASWAEPLSNLALRGVNAVGGMSDQDLQRAIQTHPLAYDPQRTSGKIGAGVGQAALAYGSGGLGAPAVFGALGGEQEYENVEQRRAAGQQIGGGQAALDVGGQAALNAGLGYLAPGGRATSGLLRAEAPTLAGAALRTLGAGAIGAGEMGAMNTAGNLIRQQTGVNPNQPLTEGLSEAALQGSIFHALPHAAAEAGAGLTQSNALQSAREANAARTTPYDFGGHDTTLPDLEKRLAGVSHDAPEGNAAQAEETPNVLAQAQAVEAQRKSLIEGHEKTTAEATKNGTTPPVEPVLPDNPHTEGATEADPETAARLANFQPVERRAPGSLKELPAEEEQRWSNLVGERATFQTPEEAAEVGVKGRVAETEVPPPRNADGNYESKYKVGETGYTFEAAPPGEHSPHWMVSVGQDEAPEDQSTRMTGAGNARQWLKSSFGQVKSFIDKESPDSMTLDAETPSRQKLYERMIPEIEKQGYKVEAEATKTGKTYTATKLEPSLFEKARTLVGKLGSEEEGGVPIQHAGLAFAQQDVIPAVKKVWTGMKNVAKDFDRSENLGFTTSDTAKKESLNIIRSLADAKMAGKQTEAALAPFLKEMPTFKDNEASALHHADLMEQGVAPSPELQPAVDLLTDLRKTNEKRAAKLGDERLNAEGLGLSRRFEFPDQESGTGSGRGSVAGSEQYRKSQKYPTYSEAYEAVKKQGGKPAYPDPLTDQIAAQYEFERSLSLRERLRKSEDEGQTKWSPDTEKLPDGHVRLDDKISHEERTAAYPKWMVGKYADMGSFEGNKFLEKNADKRVMVRPGEDAPDGYSKTDHTERGSYHAADDVAHMWNTAANQGKGSALDKLPANIARASTQFLYEYSGAHALGAFQTHIGKSIYDAVSGLWGANKQGLLSTMKDLNLYGPETNRILKEMKSPGSDPEPRIQEIARRIQRGGTDIKTKSVLDANHWKDVVDKVKTGNWQGAAISTLKGVGEDIKSGTFNSVLNRIALIAGKKEAVGQMAEGISEEAGQASQRKAAEAINRGIGRHTDVPTFKDSVISKVGKILMPAFGFRSGLVRNLAESIRDPHARAMVIGNLFAGAVTGAALCTMMGGRAPKSLQDLYNPPVGNKNEAGHEERLSMGIWSFLPRLLGADGWEGVGHELKGMLNPVIPATGEVIKNKDFSGNQIRPTGDNALSNTLAGAGHIAKQLIPLVGKAQMQQSPEAESPTLSERALHFAGWGSGHPVTSPAENEAYKIMDEHGELGGRTPEKQAEHANQTKWVREIRAGQKDQAAQEMSADPSMTDARRQNILKRAAASQNLVRLMHSPTLGADDLSRIWGVASDDDKAQMKEALTERVNKANPKSQTERAKWAALRKAVIP